MDVLSILNYLFDQVTTWHMDIDDTEYHMYPR